MIPAQVPEPFHRDGWVYEEKVDGWRILAHKDSPAMAQDSLAGDRASSRPGVVRGGGVLDQILEVSARVAQTADDPEATAGDEHLSGLADLFGGEPRSEGEAVKAVRGVNGSS
jgi:hypothetical protein